MEDAAFALQLIFAFGGGILSFVSPCVLPLLPGYLGLMSGYSVSELQASKPKSSLVLQPEHSSETAAAAEPSLSSRPSTTAVAEKDLDEAPAGKVGTDPQMSDTQALTDAAEPRVSTKRMLTVTSLFVLGFTIVFVATGAIATSLGNYLIRNQLLIEQIAGVVIIVFGVLIVGMAVVGGNLFSFFARERRVEVRPSRLGMWAPPVMGMAFGFGWTPCIGPILAVVLTTAATRDTVAQGMLLLFSFSLGLGVPFILSGLALSKAFQAMRFLRRYLNVINISAGLILIWFGWIMWSGRIGTVSGWFSDLLLRIPLLDRLGEI